MKTRKMQDFRKNVSEAGCVTKLDIVKRKSKLKLAENDKTLNWQKTKKS